LRGKPCTIDEIDKADTDFQDDMLDVLDQMQFDKREDLKRREADREMKRAKLKYAKGR